MTYTIENFEKKQIEKLTAKKRVPTFRPGDTLKVTVKIIEGEKYEKRIEQRTIRKKQ